MKLKTLMNYQLIVIVRNYNEIHLHRAFYHTQENMAIQMDIISHMQHIQIMINEQIY